MRARSGGFTLIEILVAMAVLAVALTALIKGSSLHTSNAAYLRDRTLATWVAQNQLVKLQLARTWPSIGKKDGKVEMAGIEWQWKTETKKSPDPSVRQVILKVGFADKTTTFASLQAFLGNPEQRQIGSQSPGR